MSSNKSKSEVAILEQYRVALENVKEQQEIASTMAEFGYTEEVLAEGEVLYTKTIDAYNNNQSEDDEKLAAYQEFEDAKQNLDQVYRLHRKKAKVVFRKQPEILEKLGVIGRVPNAYLKWLQNIKKFYSNAVGDTEIESKLARLKLTTEDLQEAVGFIAEVEDARATYLREKGESQDATKVKDEAFNNLDDWMGEFYAVAKIALDNNLQLLEALGKLVKS